MEIQYYNKNDMNIAVESNKSSFLSDLLSWHTTYLSNDIFILNYDNQNLELKMQIFFGTEFSECTLKVNTLELKSECKPLKDKCKTIKLNSNNLQKRNERNLWTDSLGSNNLVPLTGEMYYR